MARDLSRSAIWCLILWCACVTPGFSLAATEASDDVVWSAIIPDAFPRYVYTWHIRSDGTYREDGRDAFNGENIQATLSGRWRTEGARMILRQESIPFVFDGLVVGEIYSGMLYFNGRAVSRFCAAKGANAPDHCNHAPEVATEAGP